MENPWLIHLSTQKKSEPFILKGTSMKFYKSPKILIGVILFLVVILFGYKTNRLFAQKGGNTNSLKELIKIVKNLTPKHWKIYDEVMYFTAENLYEQINGRAEYYIGYDVIGLTFVSFDKKLDSENSINLSIYDMGTPTNAFGVFSGERSMDSQRLELGREAYRSGANYYIWHGQYYIQIITFDTSYELKDVGKKLAKNLSDLLEDRGEPVWGLSVLPKENRIPQSIQYFAVDAMGLDFMRNTYTAKYYKGDSVLSVFLSRKNSSDSAQKTLNKFTTHAKQYGKGIDYIDKENIKLASCDMGSSYDVIFQQDSLIAGVIGVKIKELAIQATIDLWKQLKSEIIEGL